MKKSLLVVVAAVAMLTGCAKQNNKNYILATGGTSGTYYPFGGAMAQIWNEGIEGMNVTAQATGASAENLRLISNGEAEFATVQNDVMDYAYNGSDMFEGKALANLATIGTLYPEVVQIAVSADSKINTIDDFRGKRISVGDAGSGVEFNAKQILEGYGISFSDFQKANLSFKESAEGIQNGTLDGCFVTAGVPNAALQELAFTKGVKLISVDAEHAKKIAAKYSFYTVETIPAGTYKGTDEDVTALAIKATLAVSAKLDTDTVYQMTKTLFENLDKLGAAHAKGKEVTAAKAVTGCSVPFHPGAAKYFKEIGYDVN
ncbi:MAG: TAXI family TRAP transporter solute-binding subunit [Treponema sp.]|nr:TAXI family TRAP transporter solute-binding subunit [Treponema sp.]